jgi:alpha-tubulin suppressor-like RCC1 family protein
MRWALRGSLALVVFCAFGIAHSAPAAAADFLPYGWGNDSSGQLALRDQLPQPAPVKVRQPVETGGQATVEVAAGARHGCSLTSAGEVVCWGANEFGQAGQDPSAEPATPARVLGLGPSIGLPVANVAAGDTHSCAVTDQGAVYCWGRNFRGQLGTGVTEDSDTPQPVQGPLAAIPIQTVALGASHTCSLTEDSQVWCWGHNGHGQLGDGTTAWRVEPVEVEGFPDGVTATTLAAGGNHTCAIGSDGAVYCWGANYYGQSAGDDVTSVITPTVVPLAPELGAPNLLAVGDGHTCVATDQAQTLCWGRNNAGQLGNGITQDSSVPVPVVAQLAGLPLFSLSAGGSHTCATGWNTETYCWGANDSGQLGDGTFENRAVPTQVLTAAQNEKQTRPAASVAAGGDFTLGLYAYAAKPGVPRDVQINGTTLSWQPPLFAGVGGETISQYRISYYPPGQSKAAVFATLPGVGTSVDLGAGCPPYAVCTLKGGTVEPGQSYRWTVAAVGSSGAASANARSATATWEGPLLTQPPKSAVAPPSMPVVNGLFGTSLSWQPPGYFGELGSNLAQYNIKIRLAGEKSFLDYATVPADRTDLDLAGPCPTGSVCPKRTGELVQGAVYEVWVYAVGADGARSKLPRGGQPYSFIWG